MLLIQNYIYFFNPELQRNPHVPRGGRFLHVHWNGKDDGRILAELHACQTNRPRRRLPRVRLGLLWWKRFQVSLRFLCVFFFNNINQSTESTRIPKCEIHVRGKHVNYWKHGNVYVNSLGNYIANCSKIALDWVCYPLRIVLITLTFQKKLESVFTTMESCFN